MHMEMAMHMDMAHCGFLVCFFLLLSAAALCLAFGDFI